MKKREIVKKKTEFDYIINKGKQTKNKFFSIFVVDLKTDEDLEPLFGIAISKKICNAVYRNKYKRQIRHIIDKNKKYFEKNKKYIIMIKKDGAKLLFLEKEKYLIDLL